MSPPSSPLIRAAHGPGKAPARRALLIAGLGALVAPRPAVAQDLSQAAPLFAGLVDPYTEETRARGPRRAAPFTARYRHLGRRLDFVASRHDTAPEGETFRAIRRAFERLSPRIVILEGIPTAWGFSPARMRDLLAAADAGGPVDSYLRGEPGFAMRLALSSGARFIGGEPASADVDRGLYAMGYAREDIAGVKILQWLPQGRIAGEFDDADDPRLRDYLDRAAARVAADFQPHYPYSRAAYETWHERQFGRPARNDPELLQRLDPSRAGRAAEISRAMTLLRDRHLYALIIATLTPDARTLVIYGSAHYITLRRALEAALGRPRYV
ncbi:MAG: hypothetical protein GC206_15900 [Alphaproteobacteria bacterium]|nr:hypothetical protein [Alphaproteobacteria bacterium]